MGVAKILTFIAEGGVRKAVKEFGKEAVKEATEKPAREASIDRLKRIKDIPLDGLSEGAIKAVNKAVVKRNALEKKILSQRGSTPAAKQMERDLEELTGHLEKFFPNIRKYPTKGIKRPVKKAVGGMAKKGYSKGGAAMKSKGGTKRGQPKGVGAALRGYGKEMR